MAHEKELFKLEQPHGPGQVFFSWQHGSGGYLATTGADNTVCIFNRHGKVEQKIRLPGQCVGMDWDCYGDLLAVICANATTLVLWDANTTKKSSVEVGLRDKLSCLIWAKTSPLLAVTTHSGNLSIYNHSTAKRVPVLGKHSKRITGGAWSSSDLLALGSEDRTLSINNADGDTLRVIQLRSEPAHLQFSEMKTDERLSGDNTVSVVVGKKTLFLYNLQDPDNPVELAFQSKYGTIVTYKWFGDGYVLLGFSGGYFVAISTHIKEVGQELFQAKNHRDFLTDIAVSHSLAKVVSCGDNTIKFHEMASLQDTPSVVTLDQEAERMDYSADGQLLAVATRGGSVSVFLSKLPMLAAAYNSRVVLLSSLTQITVYQLPFDKGKTMSSVVVEVEVEPSVLAVGPYHLVCAMNNRAWLYDLSRESEPALLSDREYIGTVSALSLNAEYTAVLLGHKIHLHYTESGGSSHGMDREMRMFPDEGEQYIVSCMALTTDFLIYASDYFLLESWVQLTEFQHVTSIKDIYRVMMDTGHQEQRYSLKKTLPYYLSQMGHIWYFLLEDWVQVTEFQHVISIKAVYRVMMDTGHQEQRYSLKKTLPYYLSQMGHIWYFLLEDWVQVTEFQHVISIKAVYRVMMDTGHQEQRYSLKKTLPYYLSQMGHIWYFLLEDWVQVTEFQHVISIKAVYPDMMDTGHQEQRYSLKKTLPYYLSQMGHIWYFLLEDWVQVTEFQHVISIKAVYRVMMDTGHQEQRYSLKKTLPYYLSQMGHIWYFLLEDWVQVTEFQHVISIKAVYPDMVGTRLIFIDTKSDGYVYNPVTDDLVLIPDMPTSASGVLWDTWHPDRNVFIVYDSENMYTYIHIRDSIKGQKVLRVGVTKLPNDQVPLVLHSGEVTLETSGGKLNSVSLSTHAAPIVATLSQSDSLHSILDLHLALMRYNEAWNVCLILDEQEAWVKFGQSALRNLDVATAIRVYRQVGDAGMVWSLENIQGVENKKLLAGHIAMFLQDFDLAQDLFLESSEPVTALTMRQDLLQWAEALRLATSLDPHRIPYISLQYANQLELTGNYSEALGHFERALTDGAGEHNVSYRGGIARCAIRCGDYRRGITMATEHNASKQLCQQCAEILEQTKKMNEAASLYEKADCFDQAASVYIQLKNWTKLGELLPKVTSPKIHLQYAKGKEAVGDYRSAVQAYQRAGDMDSVVRISLDHLKDPQEAVRIVQETRSIEGAKLVAKFFQRIGDYSSAVRFLVISGCLSDAFRLSREQDQLELYADILAQECGEGEARAEFLSLALHFETAGKHLLAGKYYFHAEDYRKAMKHLLQASRLSSEDAEALTLAVQVAGRAGDDVLANQLVELLLGEVDGEARDPKYIFKLYMARGQYREAAKTAIIIANEEQVNGNYRSAHDVLLGMCQQLRHNQLTISSELLSALMLLHSYILVRLHVCRGDHSKAACMLVRVVENISQFPCHIVPILTSAVIECHRAGLKSKAFHYATMLMRPEYRSQIEPKYSKKMEGVVRKPPRGPDNKLAPDPPEAMSPCPHCEYSLPDSQLSCPQCKNTISFCIATGWHIVRNDLTLCPNCNFPAISSQLEVLVEGGGTCPMCSEMIYPHQLARVDFDNYVQTYLQPPS